MTTIIRITAALLAAVLLTACGMDSGGPLDPVASATVRISADDQDGRAASLVSRTVSVRVTARWSDMGGQSAVLTYANAGRDAVRIDLTDLAMTGPAGRAVPASAADVTDTDLTDARTDNDDARTLLRRRTDGAMTGSIDIEAGASRRVDVQMTPFSNTQRAMRDDAITMHVPFPDGARTIGFVARNPSILPF